MWVQGGQLKTPELFSCKSWRCLIHLPRLAPGPRQSSINLLSCVSLTDTQGTGYVKKPQYSIYETALPSMADPGLNTYIRNKTYDTFYTEFKFK